MTAEAKTTKKKGRTRTTQTYSSQWNGDIPPALFIYSLNDGYPKRDITEFRKHGYKDECGPRDWRFEKSNICTVYTDALDFDDGIDNIKTIIEIKDSSSRNKLYNDLKKLIAQKGTGNTCSVSLSNGKITFRKGHPDYIKEKEF